MDPQPRNLAQLATALESAWLNIPENTFRDLSDSLPARLAAVRSAKDNEHIFGGDQGYTPEIMEEILKTARDLELEVNEDDIEELIMGHEDELTKELQEILYEEHQEAQRNMSPSEQEEDERGPMPTSALKDLLKKWTDVRLIDCFNINVALFSYTRVTDVRVMVLEWHPNQADVSRVGDIYNDNAINYFLKILKKREKQSTLDMFFNAP
ncbi:uncharacterized protein TNCV_2220021 [Trichonephila clavipes]|nr:uncharacterized protein TNCV_2220021 [Trichonephila clavipes]